MLFKDLNALMNYSDIAAGTAFERIKTLIDPVEKNGIISIIGRPLYDGLNTQLANITDEETLPEKTKKLLDMVRRVLGPLICYYYAPLSEVVMNDNGMHRVETGTNKTVFAYQGANYRKQNLLMADLATEQLYQFLEENKTDYPEWGDGDNARQKYLKLFIKSGSEFGELFSSQTPYRNYYAMRSKMEDVEQLHIKPALNDKVFDYLKKKDTDGPAFTEDEQNAVQMLKKAIAYYTVAFAIPYLNVRLDEEGISVVSDTSGKDTGTRRSATDNAVSLLMRTCTSNAQQWLAELKKETKNWHIDEDGSLKIDATDQTLPPAPGCNNDPITVPCGYQGSTLAEDYDPRGRQCETSKKKSFIM